MLNEALKVVHTMQQSKKCNIFVGRYQPFTNGHMKVIEYLYSQNQYPTFILLVRNKKQADDSRPFSIETQEKMLSSLKTPKICGYSIIESAGIDIVFNAVRDKGFEPVLWGCGTDRYKAYSAMCNKPEYRSDLNCLPEFNAIEIKRGDDDISATKVRGYIAEDNVKEFELNVPSDLHKMYDELRKEYMKSAGLKESNNILSFHDFIKVN